MIRVRWVFAMVLCLAGSGAIAQAGTELTPVEIDRMIRAEWKRQKITPAPPVDDARFLRRVTLDITGNLPSAETVRRFLSDRSPDKRARAVETLLSGPGYVKRWVAYWDDVLMGRTMRPMQNVDRVAFRQWLTEKFQKNTPYNQFVYELLTATGQNSAGGSLARAAGMEMPAMLAPFAAPETGDPAKVNGAVNWFLKYAQTPADLSGAVSRIFLGVQIQCAQCHDHKTEKWTQEDFRRFTACFIRTRPVPVDLDRDQLRGIRRFELRDIERPLLRNRLRSGGGEYTGAIPAALDGTEFTRSPNRRRALAAWITAPENPYFAPAIVNRMWAHFMGRGFVDPIDDFRPSNPAIMPELLQKLSEDFIAHGYDLKRLIRLICNTQAYQLSAAPSRNDPENLYWSRYRLKPMGPELILDALITATGMEEGLQRVAGAGAEAMKAQILRQLIFLFDVDEEFEQKDFEGTIPQALLLLNGSLVNNGASLLPGNALAQVLALPGDDAVKIEELYLRTLSRKPTSAELKHWQAFLNAPRTVVQTDSIAGAGRRPQRGLGGQVRRMGGGPDPFARILARTRLPEPEPKQQAFEDLFWALLNSSEFIFNH